MKLKDIKKLSRKEFVERYPFLQEREWDYDMKSTILSVYDEDCKGTDAKKGDPILWFYINDWWGWSDLLLCWAEKVKSVLDSMSEDERRNFYVSEVREKFGRLRIYVYNSNKFINNYTYMLEHLSRFACFYCGKLTKSLFNTKLIAYQTEGNWIDYSCKKCAKKRFYNYTKVKDNWFTGYKYFDDDKCHTVKLDCRKLLKGMY